MYSISDELRQRFEQGERKTARVTIGNYAVDQTITEADIVSNGLSIDRYCVTGNKIEIGSAVAAELSLVLDNSSGKFDGIVFEGAQLFVEIGIAGDESNYIPCGKFTVDEPPRNNTRISLKALDYMMLFDNKADVSKLNFSNAEALVKSVCSECKVDLSSNVDFTKFANTNIELSEPTTEVTYRQLLQWACEILGVCAYMDGVGELMLAWYSDGINATFDPSVRYSGTMHETDIKISGVTVKKGDSDITKGTADDVVLIIENNQLIDGNLEKIEAIAEGVLAKTGGFTYRPFECSCLPMPYLYPLDKVAYTYKDKAGKDVSFYSVITNHTFGLNTTSSFAAKGETAQQKNYSKSKGVTKAEIDAAVAEAMKGVNFETDRFYVMYSAYPNGRLNGEENGKISWSDTANADTQYLGTCVTSNKTQPGNPDEYSWVKIGGKDGTSATAYRMTPDSRVIVKDSSGSLSPSKLVLSATSQIGADAPIPCSCYFIVLASTDEGMTNFLEVVGDGKGTKFSINFSEVELDDAIKAQITALKAYMYLGDEIDSSKLLDTQIIPVIHDGGESGEDAYTVILSNENHTFAGDDTKALNNQSTTCDVIAYKGTTQQAVSIGDITTPTGMSVSKINNGKTNAQLQVSVDPTLSPLSGSISIPITIDSNKSFTKTFSYSVALKGGKGDPGKGISSITEYYLASADASASPASELVTPVNFSMAVQEVSKTSGVTGCALGGDGYYSVDMNKVNSSYFLARLTFNVTRPTDVVLKCINYAEYDWDYMMVSKISTNANEYKFGESSSVTTTEKGYAEVDFEILHSENPVDVVYENVAVGAHYVYVKVYKDSSNTKDKEAFKFKAMEPASWSTTVPTDYGTDKPYLWNYTRTDYSDGTFQESSPAVISCYGGQGEDGKGISSIEEYYCTTTSNSPPEKTSFTKHTPGNTTPKPDATNQYLWNYEKIIYTKGDPTVTDVRLVCVFGKNGDNGRGVDSVKTQYYLSTSNSSQTGGSWQDAMPAWQANRYLWKREVVTYKNPAGTEEGTPILDTSWDKLGDISVVDDATKGLNEALAATLGLKKSVVNGVFYWHTNDVLQNSKTGDVIFKLGSTGFGICTSGWNNGDPQYSFGATTAGKAVWDTLTARKISADMIEAGTIEALSTAKLHSSWNLNNGKIVFLSEDERVVGSIHAELTRVVDGTEYPLGGVGLTIEDLDNDTITQIANGVIRLGDPDGILEPVLWLAAEKFKQFLDKTYVIDMTKKPNNHETIITKDDIQTKVVRCEDIELYKFPGQPSKTVKLYDAVNSIAAMVSSTQLYPAKDTDGPSNGTIALKYSVEGYDFIEIYFRDSNREEGGYTKIYDADDKTALLSLNEPYNGGIYVRTTRVAISGSTITPDSSTAQCLVLSTGSGTYISGNQIYITRVMGGKYIS